jgi:hypothetical protein
MSLSTNGATALAADHSSREALHVQKLSLQRIDVGVGHPRAVIAPETLNCISRSFILQKLIGVNKVGLKAQSMVTYNVKITVGSPEQELTVIFDTGSFMCAVFSDVSPDGMKELGLLSVRQYFRRSTSATFTVLALALACSAFVVALAVRARGKKGSRRDAHPAVLTAI